MGQNFLSNKGMNKEEIIRELKKVHKNAKLPGGIEFDLMKDGNMRVLINKPYENMQNDDAAFEGWILILKYWLSEKGILVDKIILEWDSIYEKLSSSTINGFSFDMSLALLKTPAQYRHYNRFLFRVMMFMKMNYSWFDIHENNKVELSLFESWLSKNTFLLNGPLSEGKEPRNIDSENYLEHLFVNDKKDLLTNHLKLKELYRQLPLGLFKSSIKAENAVFPSRKSAVDVWGVSNNNTLNILELKYSKLDSKNIGVGIISELYCYLMIIFQACCIEGGLFIFTGGVNKKDIRGSKNLIRRDYQSLQGYFLVDEIHPLINEGVINMLNAGLAQIGKIEISKIEYEYDGVNSNSLRIK